MDNEHEKRRIDVSDIEKLRPELLDMSVAELERRRTEIEMAIAHQAKRAQEEQVKKDLAAAQEAFDEMMSAINKLNNLNRLPDRLKSIMTSDDGTFQPGRYLKRPRS